MENDDTAVGTVSLKMPVSTRLPVTKGRIKQLTLPNLCWVKVDFYLPLRSTLTSDWDSKDKLLWDPLLLPELWRAVVHPSCQSGTWGDSPKLKLIMLLCSQRLGTNETIWPVLDVILYTFLLISSSRDTHCTF